MKFTIDDQHFLHERLEGEGFEGQAMTACGLRVAPYNGTHFVPLPEGGKVTLTTDPADAMCGRCCRITARPGYAPVTTVWLKPSKDLEKR